MVAVCVFCSSASGIDPVYLRLAADVGVQIAARGHSLVSGGGRVSMMGEVARAVRARGGRTLGVIPRALTGLEVADDDADELVVTADMRQRKARMDHAADAFVVLPGGLGTLEELLEIWVSRSLGMHAKPVVACDPTGYFAGLRAAVEGMVDAGFVRAAAAAEPDWTTTPDAALDAVEAGCAAAVPDASGRQHRFAEEALEAEP
ncbi:MAG: TIGR00730 family Rossman fold protein [Actinomycetes bacterium]